MFFLTSSHSVVKPFIPKNIFHYSLFTPQSSVLTPTELPNKLIRFSLFGTLFDFTYSPKHLVSLYPSSPPLVAHIWLLLFPKLDKRLHRVAGLYVYLCLPSMAREAYPQLEFKLNKTSALTLNDNAITLNDENVSKMNRNSSNNIHKPCSSHHATISPNRSSMLFIFIVHYSYDALWQCL